MKRTFYEADRNGKGISVISASVKSKYISMYTWLLFTFLFLPFLYCQNTNLYYTFIEGNIKVLQAFSIKDSSCGTTHTVNQFLLGDSYKNDVDACIDAIYSIDCEQWKESNPTPRECLGVSTKNR